MVKIRDKCRYSLTDSKETLVRLCVYSRVNKNQNRCFIKEKSLNSSRIEMKKKKISEHIIYI